MNVSGAERNRMEIYVAIKFVKMSHRAMTPAKGSTHAAGLDLFSAENCVVMPHERKLIKTDIMMQIPPGCYGRIAPRSGLAVNHCIDVAAGVIDQDYRGNICVVLVNNSEKQFRIEQGSNIAQLILERVFNPILTESTELPPSARGTNGFGSTSKLANKT